MGVFAIQLKKSSVIKRRTMILICSLLILIGVSSCISGNNQAKPLEATSVKTAPIPSLTFSDHTVATNFITKTSSKINVLPTYEYRITLTPTVEIERTNTPAIVSSPPLGYILFSVVGQSNDGIYIINADGENLRKLTKEMVMYENPIFSADGEWIYFQSDLDNPHGVFDIYRIDPNGNNLIRLTNEEMTNHGISTSPDGSKIVFVGQKSVPNNNHFDLFIVDSTGVSVKQITSDHIWKRNPSWSPDGEKIAYIASEKDVDYGDLYIFNLHDEKTVRLTNDNQMWPYSRLTWSPDSTQLTVVRYSNNGKNVYILNADGTNMMKISMGTEDFYPIWSPDGTKIALESNENNESELYLYSLDHSANDILAKQPKFGGFMDPAWSPDGRYIIYVSDSGKNGKDFDLYMIEISSRKVHLLVSNLGKIISPKWVFPIY